MSTTAPEVTKTPEQLEAEAEAARLAQEARAAHVAEVVAEFAPLIAENARVRIAFDGRKMSVPGRLFSSDEIPVGLATNWGLELDLTHEPYTGIEVKELDSGRFVKYVAPAPVAVTPDESQDGDKQDGVSTEPTDGDEPDPESEENEELVSAS